MHHSDENGKAAKTGGFFMIRVIPLLRDGR
jgi:hypothetical protein